MSCSSTSLLRLYGRPDGDITVQRSQVLGGGESITEDYT